MQRGRRFQRGIEKMNKVLKDFTEEDRKEIYNQYIRGTYEFLDGMQKALEINHKINRKKDQKERNINSWNITIGRHVEVINILKTLYLNCSTYLKRKQERVIMILEEEKTHEQFCQSA